MFVVVGSSGVVVVVVVGEEGDLGEFFCLLCRGKVKGWKVVEVVCSYLN